VLAAFLYFAARAVRTGPAPDDKPSPKPRLDPDHATGAA
jgi:hypothetical protein